MARFQIRDDDFGLALVEADSAREALLQFYADKERGRIRPLVVEDGDGAQATVDGQTLRAVPL
jgi:hypothetical protein